VDVFYESAGVEGFDELGEIDRLPPLGELRVLADGRMIWLKFEDLPEGASSLSTGLLEQRLTPQGVELMRSAAEAAVSSGEARRCTGRHGVSYVSADGRSEGTCLSRDNEQLARVLDPWSWLPDAAWEDRQIRAYVPTRYVVRFWGEDAPGDSLGIPMDLLTAQLPAAVVDLIDTKYWEPGNGGPYAVFTTDEARALAAALDDAGSNRTNW
jgi:hypothetical protein